MSRWYLAKNGAQPMLKVAVPTKICASPVQPARSSRCGQSVGMLRKLPRWPQRMLLCSCSRRGSEQLNDQIHGQSELSTTARTSSGLGAAASPLTST